MTKIISALLSVAFLSAIGVSAAQAAELCGGDKKKTSFCPGDSKKSGISSLHDDKKKEPKK